MCPAENHYTTLALPPPWTGHRSSTADIKAAYRKALLQHHPDKAASLGIAPAGESCPSCVPRIAATKANQPTIDAITQARATLLDPALRAAHDRELLVRAADQRANLSLAPTGTGLEMIDLEDMAFDDATATFTRPCRCGHEQGFLVTEQDLEREADSGEVFVSCPGCSLTARIVYQAES